MTNKMFETLEYNKILNMMEEYALSNKVKEEIRNLEPYLSEEKVLLSLKETTEAKLIIEQWGNPPLAALNDLEKSLSLLGKGILLMPEQLESIAQFLTACRRLKAYLKKAENISSVVASYGDSIYDLSEIEDEINMAIRGSEIDDKASPKLGDIRRKIINAGAQIKSKLDSLLRNNKNWFSESFVSIRNEHYTLPVKKEYKRQVDGTVIDVSQSGNTYFIEPSSTRKLQDEIALLRIEEENEVRRILYTLTALVEEHIASININIEAMESLDFIFAKAKLSIAMKAVEPEITTKKKIVIKEGRHPLLKSENIVPLDFHIGNNVQGVVITGPNTGGKTVALKTIGLLSIMAQSGLHVPVEYGCFSMNNYVLCDIGDGQSITENLSTFSSHITNIIQILELADDQSLVLLDELGSGTDPAEGMGIATAVLEELCSKNCLFVATTHYPEIKELAKNNPGMINARMAFDRESLQPLYRLEIGEAGESCALYIAKRLGLPQHMIERASIAAYGEEKVNPSLNEIPLNKSKQVQKSARRVKTSNVKQSPSNTAEISFTIGDSVMVYPQKEIGIVYQKANEKGEVGVQIKKKKLLINHKRLKLRVPASELYPEDYDFSIIFDTVENRKARRVLERKHDPNVVVKLKDEKDTPK